MNYFSKANLLDFPRISTLSTLNIAFQIFSNTSPKWNFDRRSKLNRAMITRK